MDWNLTIGNTKCQALPLLTQEQVQESAEWRPSLLGSGWPETIGLRREGTQAEARGSFRALKKCGSKWLLLQRVHCRLVDAREHYKVRDRPAPGADAY